MKKTLKNFLPTIIWALIIFILSSISSLRITKLTILQHFINVFAHFMEYAILTLLFYNSLRKEGLKEPKLSNLSLLIPTFYAFSDEFHQFFVPGRQADPFDWAIDILGIITAVQILRRNKKEFQK